MLGNPIDVTKFRHFSTARLHVTASIFTHDLG